MTRACMNAYCILCTEACTDAYCILCTEACTDAGVGLHCKLPHMHCNAITRHRKVIHTRPLYLKSEVGEGLLGKVTDVCRYSCVLMPRVCRPLGSPEPRSFVWPPNEDVHGHPQAQLLLEPLFGYTFLLARPLHWYVREANRRSRRIDWSIHTRWEVTVSAQVWRVT